MATHLVTIGGTANKSPLLLAQGSEGAFCLSFTLLPSAPAI
jgi:hypothetical protein